MLFGKYASRKSEASVPSLWDGLQIAFTTWLSPPTGLNLFDVSGRNRHGIISGAAASVWTGRDTTQRLALNGSSNFISLPNLTFSQTAGATFIIRFTRSAAGVLNGAFNVGGAFLQVVGTGGEFYPNLSGGSPVLSISSGSFSSSGESFVVITSFNGANVVRVNGSARASNTGAQTTSWTPSSGNQIGRYNSAGGRYFLGDISEFYAWNRLLTFSEMELLRLRKRALFLPRTRATYLQSTGVQFRRSLSNRIGSRSLN